jgi:hypothetical protein
LSPAAIAECQETNSATTVGGRNLSKWRTSFRELLIISKIKIKFISSKKSYNKNAVVLADVF